MRVLNELGVGKVYFVCLVVVVFVVFGIVYGCVMVSFIYLFCDVWGWVFINDFEVVNYVVYDVFYFVIFVIFYGIGVILLGMWVVFGLFNFL